MGDARRRQLAGNTKPDKQWHGSKASERHAKQVAAQERAMNRKYHPSLPAR